MPPEPMMAIFILPSLVLPESRNCAAFGVLRRPRPCAAFAGVHA
jgi:hypothetical protein